MGLHSLSNALTDTKKVWSTSGGNERLHPGLSLFLQLINFALSLLVQLTNIGK